MSLEQARKNILAHFSTTFTEVVSPNIAWDNVHFTPTDGTPWIRVSIQGSLSDFVSLGGASVKKRCLGIVFVQVFVPEGTGTQRADEIVDAIADALEARQLATGETFQATSKIAAGNSNGWYQLNASTPFYYDEQRSL